MRGTEVAETYYTLFETARTCGVDPSAYLRYAAAAALRLETPQLPHEWATSRS